MESEQATPVDSIKDVVWSSVKVPEFDKHLKIAGGHIVRNIVEITIKMKTIVWKLLMMKMDLALNNLQRLICHKNQPTNQPTWMLIKYMEKKLHKNAMCCFEQILEAIPHKTAVVWPLTSHLTSKINKMCKALLEE